MYCEACGALSPDSEAHYCASCGRPMSPPTTRVCRRCSTKNPPDAEFCMNCGKPFGDDEHHPAGVLLPLGAAGGGAAAGAGLASAGGAAAGSAPLMAGAGASVATEALTGAGSMAEALSGAGAAGGVMSGAGAASASADVMSGAGAAGEALSGMGATAGPPPLAGAGSVVPSAATSPVSLPTEPPPLPQPPASLQPPPTQAPPSPPPTPDAAPVETLPEPPSVPASEAAPTPGAPTSPVGNVVTGTGRRLIGHIIRIAGIAAGTIGILAVLVGALLFTGDPSPCVRRSSVVSAAAALRVQQKWDAFSAAGPGASVEFTEEEITSRAATYVTEKDVPIRNLQIYFCPSGSTEAKGSVDVMGRSINVLVRGSLNVANNEIEVDSVEAGNLPSFLATTVVNEILDRNNVRSLALGLTLTSSTSSDGIHRLTR